VITRKKTWTMDALEHHKNLHKPLIKHKVTKKNNQLNKNISTKPIYFLAMFIGRNHQHQTFIIE